MTVVQGAQKKEMESVLRAIIKKLGLFPDGGPMKVDGQGAAEDVIGNLVDSRDAIYGDHEALYNLVDMMWKAMDLMFIQSGMKLKGSSRVEMKLIMMKMCRTCFNPTHRDNYTDIKGYVELVERGEMKPKLDGRNEKPGEHEG